MLDFNLPCHCIGNKSPLVSRLYILRDKAIQFLFSSVALNWYLVRGCIHSVLGRDNITFTGRTVGSGEVGNQISNARALDSRKASMQYIENVYSCWSCFFSCLAKISTYTLLSKVAIAISSKECNAFGKQ